MADDKLLDPNVNPGEFKAIPLEDIIAAPLTGAIEAQKKSAEATRDFIKSFIDEDGNPINVEFKVAKNLLDQGGAETSESMQVKAPLLSIVPTPHLAIDEVITHFSYEIAQTITYEKEKEAKGEGEGQTGWLVSKFAKVQLSGSISNKTTEASTANRSGSLEITVKASQAPMPKGLDKILSVLANQITASPVDETGQNEDGTQG